MSTLDLVIPTMLVSGVAGGLINSFLNDPEIEKPLKQVARMKQRGIRDDRAAETPYSAKLLTGYFGCS